MRRGEITYTITAAVLVLGAGGCTAAGDNQHLADRSRLANDLAGRLSQSATATYTATYILAGGGSVTLAQAQRPLRVAYRYPGGELVFSPAGTMDCRAAGAPAGSGPSVTASPERGTPGPASPATGTPRPQQASRCVLSAPVSPGTDPVGALLALAGDSALVAPAAVVSLLSAAALDANAVIEQRDTTLAGENATCVDVTGTGGDSGGPFTACITVGGILGSFHGTVDGHAVDVTLDGYDERVMPGAFAAPAGATVADNRNGKR